MTIHTHAIQVCRGAIHRAHAAALAAAACYMSRRVRKEP